MPYIRCSDGSAALFGPEHAVLGGRGEVCVFAANEDDGLAIDMDRATRLGSYEAIKACFAAGDRSVPPLRILS